MNVILFFILFYAFIQAALYLAKSFDKKKIFGKYYFWTVGVMTVGYSIIFTGIFDKIAALAALVSILYVKFYTSMH